MKTLIRYAPSAALFVVGAGLQVSGVESIWLAVVFWAAAAVLLVAASIPWIRRIRVVLVSDSSMAASKPPATAEESAQRYIRGRTLRIAELARDDLIIRSRTFEDCDIYGPAVLIAVGTGIMQECGFEGDAETVFWEIPAERVRIAGAIALEDCVFRRCRFSKIGLAGTREFIKKAREGFANA
jgi:hypothetical protein